MRLGGQLESDNRMQNNKNLLTGSQFLTLLVPLGLAAGAAHLLSIEASLQLPSLMWLVAGGFAIHAWLPMNLRLPFFLALNAAALLVLLGPVPGLMALGIGLSLIFLANLKTAWHLRVGLVLIAALMLFARETVLPEEEWWRSSILAGHFQPLVLVIRDLLPIEMTGAPTQATS